MLVTVIKIQMPSIRRKFYCSDFIAAKFLEEIKTEIIETIVHEQYAGIKLM